MEVVIADSMEDEVVKGISALGSVAYKPSDLKTALKEADVLIVRSATKVTKELISDAGRLKVVARAGVGLDNVDQGACRARGIKVLNTPGASSNAVAELALGLMIGALRNIQKAHHQMKGGRWEKKTLTGGEIQGRTLGIIGYGRIGAMLAQKARALGMDVIAYSPPPRHDDGAATFVDDFSAFLSKSDVISIHVPSTPKTMNMINRDSISKMKDNVVIINTADVGHCGKLNLFFSGIQGRSRVRAWASCCAKTRIRGIFLALEW